MPEFLAGWRIAVRRLVADWRLMLVAALGVLVAATLLAVTPIYASAMTDLGLHFRLDRLMPRASDHVPYVEVTGLLLGSPQDRARRAALDRIAAARVGWLGTLVTERRSPGLDLAFPGHEDEAPDPPVAVTERGDEPIRQRWIAFVYSLSDFEQYVDVVEGRFPGPSSAGLEVVLPDGFQRHAKLGDRVQLSALPFDDCAHVPPAVDEKVAKDEVSCEPTTVVTVGATATVVGFVSPTDPTDLRWQQFSGGWRVADQPVVRGVPSVPGAGTMALITTEEQFAGAFTARMPELAIRQRNGVMLDVQALTLADVPRAIDDLAAWRADASERLGLTVGGSLNALDVLKGFRNAQTFSQVPMLLILLQVVGIVLYYVVMVMTMLLDRQAEEIGVLRSRGASTAQLVGQHLIEGLLSAVPAAVLAPWLAAGIVELLGLTPGFQPITKGALLTARVTPIAALLGAGGAALALVAILLPSYAIARRGMLVTRHEESRPAARGFVQRYYLDVGVVVLAGFLLWQLRQRGSVFDPGSVGGWSTDPMLLLAPLMITLAAVLLMLRLYPPLLRLGVTALLLLRGTAVAIGLRRAGRSPSAYARLMLLLVMAISVGTFAASYGPTVGLSLDERVRYQVGVDARATIEQPSRFTSNQEIPNVRSFPGVVDAAAIRRGSVSTPGGTSVALLSIDVARASTMLWSRSDFASQPLPDLLQSMKTNLPPTSALPLPDETVAVSIAIRGSDLGRDTVSARFREADGVYEDSLFVLKDAGANGWITAVATVPLGAQFPIDLVGFSVTDRQGIDLRREGRLQIDRVSAITWYGETLVEDFEQDTLGWSLFGPPGRDETFRSVGGADAASGARFTEWRWAAANTPQKRVLAVNDPAVPLFAIMNPAAMTAFGTSDRGDARIVLNGLQVPAIVRGTATLFPTLDPSQPFVVLSDAQLHTIAGTLGASDLGQPNELWLRFRDGAPIGLRRATLASLGASESPLRVKPNPFIAAALLDDTNGDPTLQAGGSGILFIAFFAVLSLSAVGIVATIVLGARARAVEFVVLRAIGASSVQILGGLLAEWSVVLVMSAVVGLALGRAVASLMLGFLNVTERGDRVIPPFIVQTDWMTLGLGIALLTLVFATTLVTSWRTAMRQSAQSQLRLTK